MAQAIASSAYMPIWWNVVFLERDAESWWDVFSPRWARHVLAYGFSEPLQAWVIVNPMADQTLIEVVPDASFDDHLAAWVETGAVILRVKASSSRPEAGRLLQTCSSIIGRIVGAQSAWRPTALFRTLLAQGAEVRHDPHEHQGVIAPCRS